MTQRELANYLATYTTSWSSSRVAQLEAGRRRELDLRAMLRLMFALHRPLSELLEGVTVAMVIDQPDPDGSSPEVWEAIDGLEKADARSIPETIWRRPTDSEKADPSHLHVLGDDADTWIIETGDGEPIDADERLAARLGVTAEQVIEIAMALWGHSLTVERDLRAEKWAEEGGELRAARGQQTRMLSDIVHKQLRAERLEEAQDE